MQNVAENDSLVLDARKRLTMSGVQSVDGFTDKTLNLTVAGTRVRIEGENIKILAFSKNSGQLIADGKFNGIKYAAAKLSLFKRLFK